MNQKKKKEWWIDEKKRSCYLMSPNSLSIVLCFVIRKLHYKFYELGFALIFFFSFLKYGLDIGLLDCFYLAPRPTCASDAPHLLTTAAPLDSGVQARASLKLMRRGQIELARVCITVPQRDFDNIGLLWKLLET